MFPGYGATPFPLPLSAFEPTFFESPLLFPNSSSRTTLPGQRSQRLHRYNFNTFFSQGLYELRCGPLIGDQSVNAVQRRNFGNTSTA